MKAFRQRPALQLCLRVIALSRKEYSITFSVTIALLRLLRHKIYELKVK